MGGFFSSDEAEEEEADSAEWLGFMYSRRLQGLQGEDSIVTSSIVLPK